MSDFKVEVLPVTIEPHPNADRIEIARIGDYMSIVKKGDFVNGDLAAYIPEASIVPEWILRKMKLWDEEKGKGKLAGKAGNRVKVARIRGIVSQGLVLQLEKVELR